jgi:hypothetical protein
MAIPGDSTVFVEDSHGTTPEGTGGLGSSPSALADRRRSPEPLHQMVNMALAVSVILGYHVGFAPFRNGNWRAGETLPPSL